MCDISSNKKYLTRPSPPRPANEAGCRGKTFVGNDGNFWTSKANSQGIYRWVSDSVAKKVAGKKSATKKKVVGKKSDTKKKVVGKKSDTKKKVVGKKSSDGRPKSKSGLFYRISFPLIYLHDGYAYEDVDKKPTKKQLSEFYKKQSEREVKEILVQVVHLKLKGESIVKFKMSEAGVVSFSLPKSIPLPKLKEFIQEINNFPLMDGPWEADPGKGLVYKNGGVITFGKVKISNDAPLEG